MPTYVSTSCLPAESSVFAILEAYARAGLTEIELGNGREYIQDVSPDRFRRYGTRFIVHNYFPPPREPLIVNLASHNSEILQQSRAHIKNSIAFCHDLGCDLFSFHAGFRADPDDMLVFPKADRVCDYEAAFQTFVDSVKEIDEYAQTKGVKIAVENNVLSSRNVVDGQNPYLLLCTADEFEEFWHRIDSSNVGLLLDLGHLKVTSHWLRFDRYRFIDRLAGKVFAFHLHENDGLDDQHLQLDDTSWCLQVIRNARFAGVPAILETPVSSIQEIVSQVRLLESPC